MRKLNNKTGFTLAELLIVVAIIAILVAIGIPAFSTAMERSRETVDLSNIRGAYAEFMAGTLGSDANTGYYKINIKQRQCKDWVVDCNGFLTNIVEWDSDASNYVMPTIMPADDGTKTNAFKTGDIWVKFTTKGVTTGKGKSAVTNPDSEKPMLSYVAANTTDSTKLTTNEVKCLGTKYSPKTPTTAGYVTSGDGWYLTHE